MFRRIGSIAIAGSLLASSGWARAPDPSVLKRTEKWVLDYDRDACHLVAQFGEGDSLVAARFTRYEPGTSFVLAVYGNRLRGLENRVEAKIDFGAGQPIAADGMSGRSGKLSAVFFTSMRIDGWHGKAQDEARPDILPAQEAAVTGMTVAIRGKRLLRLDFGSFGKPMEQMRDCTANLVRHWGYDPAVQAALTRPVKPVEAPQKWLRSSDFPTTAMWSGANGIVQFRLDVDPDGKVTGCYILARTSPDLFADVTCNAITRRAKLQPALDAQGKAVRSYFVQKVIWRAAG
jgi:TonB-like protein